MATYDENRSQPLVKQGPILSTRPCKSVRALVQWIDALVQVLNVKDVCNGGLYVHTGYDQKVMFSPGFPIRLDPFYLLLNAQ
jgi:hypothetical protein